MLSAILSFTFASTILAASKLTVWETQADRIPTDWYISGKVAQGRLKWDEILEPSHLHTFTPSIFDAEAHTNTCHSPDGGAECLPCVITVCAALNGRDSREANYEIRPYRRCRFVISALAIKDLRGFIEQSNGGFICVCWLFHSVPALRWRPQYPGQDHLAPSGTRSQASSNLCLFDVGSRSRSLDSEQR